MFALLPHESKKYTPSFPSMQEVCSVFAQFVFNDGAVQRKPGLNCPSALKHSSSFPMVQVPDGEIQAPSSCVAEINAHCASPVPALQSVSSFEPSALTEVSTSHCCCVS